MGSLFSPEREHFMRLLSLIGDLGTQAFQKTLDHCATTNAPFAVGSPMPSFNSVLQKNYNALKKLKIKPITLTAIQWKKLFPGGGQVVCTGDLDITLCSILLRSHPVIDLCGLIMPTDGWDRPPTLPDVSTLEGSLAQLKSIRNKLSHSQPQDLTTVDFNTLFTKAETAIRTISVKLPGGKFNVTLQQIQYYKTLPISPQVIQQTHDLLQRWEDEERNLDKKIDNQSRQIQTNQNVTMHFMTQKAEENKKEHKETRDFIKKIEKEGRNKKAIIIQSVLRIKEKETNEQRSKQFRKSMQGLMLLAVFLLLSAYILPNAGGDLCVSLVFAVVMLIVIMEVLKAEDRKDMMELHDINSKLGTFADELYSAAALQENDEWKDTIKRKAKAYGFDPDFETISNGSIIMTFYCLGQIDLPEKGEEIPLLSEVMTEACVTQEIREIIGKEGYRLYAHVTLIYIKMVKTPRKLVETDPAGCGILWADRCTSIVNMLNKKQTYTDLTGCDDIKPRKQHAQWTKEITSFDVEDMDLNLSVATEKINLERRQKMANPFTSETEYFMRLVLLINEKGAKAFRESLLHFSTLKYEVSTFDDVLHDVNAQRILHKLKGRGKPITAHQWLILYHGTGVRIKVNDLDITLCFVLLRNICGLTPPLTTWDKPPPPTDSSLEGGLAQLKNIRNFISHCNVPKLSHADFCTHFKNASDAILNIQHILPKWSVTLEELNRYKRRSISPALYTVLLNVIIEWAKQDSDLINEIGNVKIAVNQSETAIVSALNSGVAAIMETLEKLSAGIEAPDGKIRHKESPKSDSCVMPGADSNQDVRHNDTGRSPILTCSPLAEIELEMEILLRHTEKITGELKTGVIQVTRLVKEVEVISTYQSDFKGAQIFEYTVDEERVEQVPLQEGEYETTCPTCKRTCNFPCRCKDMMNCSAMNNGYCEQCPGKCPWTQHKMLPYRHQVEVMKVTKTAEDLRKRYHYSSGEIRTMETVLIAIIWDLKKATFDLILKTKEMKLCGTCLEELGSKFERVNRKLNAGKNKCCMM